MEKLFDFVYTLASTNNNQSAPNLVKMYVNVRSWKSWIMNLIGPGWSELSALHLKNSDIWLRLHSIICKCRPVSTKLLYTNIYVQHNLNEFDHGSNWIEKTGVICSWIGKNCCIWLCLLFSIYKYKPISSKPGHNVYELKISEWVVISDQWVLSALEIEKLNFISLFGIYIRVNLYCLVLRWAI